ncbi:MAG: CAP domain-containing protein [Patescibacteria group bacterium]|mgnify:CR=1 FL=1
MARRKRKAKRRLPLAFVLIVGLIVGFVFTRPQKNPSPYLPIPKTSKVFLPGALTLPHVESSVLGAQTIDPLEFIQAINNERTKTGAPILRVSSILMKAAQMRADVILKHQNFSHQDPFEGIELLTVLPKVNYHYAYASENIGMGGVSGPDFAGGFMNSTSHRDNLLNPALTDTGAAIVTGPYKQYYVNIAVQLFAIPGGLDEELGYTKEDIKKYKKQLSYLDNQLLPIRWVVERLVVGSSYTDDRRQKLERQRTIVASVYERMTEEEPLTPADALLVAEYNKLTEGLSS